jgi:transcriptional regulator with XRE-family HTH domain
MDVSNYPIHQRIAQNCKRLRAAAGWSLQQLAEKSGVSRSALSLIERAEASPTAVVLDRVAAALGVTIGVLVGPHDADSAAGASGSPLSRAKTQTVWKDPASGYSRRSLSPTQPWGTGPRTELIEVHFPPQQRVALESSARAKPLVQQVWLIEGQMHISIGSDTHTLVDGDCLAMSITEPVVFHNPGLRTARYLVAIDLD